MNFWSQHLVRPEFSNHIIRCVQEVPMMLLNLSMNFYSYHLVCPIFTRDSHYSRECPAWIVGHKHVYCVVIFFRSIHDQHFCWPLGLSSLLIVRFPVAFILWVSKASGLRLWFCRICKFIREFATPFRLIPWICKAAQLILGPRRASQLTLGCFAGRVFLPAGALCLLPNIFHAFVFMCMCML